MKKIAVIAVTVLFAFLSIQLLQTENESEVKIHNEQLSISFLSTNIPIVDIRTQKEWKETGVVKNSIQITFYDEDGKYDENKFFNSLKKFSILKTTKFAILCKSGNRSNRVTRFLMSKGYENVINLAGGVKQGFKNNVKLVFYND